MRFSPRLSLFGLLLFIGLALGACSDDASKSKSGAGDAGADIEERGDGASADARAEDSGGPDTREDTGGDVAQESSDAADGSEVVELPPQTGHEGCAYPGDPEAECPPWAYGDYGPASFVNYFYIEKSGTCCADFTGNGTDDSAMGNLISTLSAVIGVPFNDVIAAQIANGNLVFLFEYAYLSDAVNDPALQINLMLGEDSDNYFGPNMNGEGYFNIKPESLDAQGNPKSDFPTAKVENGRLSVEGGSAAILIPLNIDGSLMDEVQVERLSISADVDPASEFSGGERVALHDGELAGAVSLEDFFGAINKMAATCDCIASQPLYVEVGPGEWGCVEPLESTCGEDSDALCKTLGNRQQCELVATVVNRSADVDLDADAIEDALSLGARFSAVGASIVGVGN